jgi:hypothetical protein
MSDWFWAGFVLTLWFLITMRILLGKRGGKP